MRPYETLVVLRTDLGEEAAKHLARFQSVIVSQGGTIDENRDWGVRDLAYPIGKQRQGHFHLIEYQAEPQTVKELERNLRIVEGVLRFVSVQQEHTGLPEPRVRENYDRRDAPLSEMRSPERAEEAPAGAVAEAAELVDEELEGLAEVSEAATEGETEDATEVQS
ncbi:MAG: 30S ribosomal protein S6 [Candidatus Binatia bacterium]